MTAGTRPAAPASARLNPRPARRGSWQRRDSLLGYLFVAPSVLGALLLVIVPLGAVAWYSLHDWNALSGQFRFVGGENYAALAEDPTLRSSLLATVLFSVGIVVLNVALALLLAVLLNQKVRG